MDGGPTKPWTAFWQTLTRFQKEKVAPWMALRNALGMALPLGVGVALGAIGSGLIACTGALNVAFADSSAPYAQRARRILPALTVVVAASLILGLKWMSPRGLSELSLSIEMNWLPVGGMIRRMDCGRMTRVIV